MLQSRQGRKRGLYRRYWLHETEGQLSGFGDRPETLAVVWLVADEEGIATPDEDCDTSADTAVTGGNADGPAGEQGGSVIMSEEQLCM